jgi:hypothetical protein
MTGPEDPALAALDARIRAQLANAAEDYASRTDLQARLTAILEAGTRDDDGAAAAHN